jgi:hypothetical protein
VKHVVKESPLYKRITVETGSLKDLQIARAERPLTERQKRLNERAADFEHAINQAAVGSKESYVRIKLGKGDKPATQRAAFTKVWNANPREGVDWGMRGGDIIISRGPIPGGRGRAKTKR